MRKRPKDLSKIKVVQILRETRVFQKSTLYEISLLIFYLMHKYHKELGKKLGVFGGHLTPPPEGHILYGKFKVNV